MKGAPKLIECCAFSEEDTEQEAAETNKRKLLIKLEFELKQPREMVNLFQTN